MNRDRLRFESTKEKYDRFLRIQGHLDGLIDNFHKHVEKSHENFDLGMSRSFEYVTIVAAVGFIRAFEDYMRVEQSEEVVLYYTDMVFHNLFTDLLDLEIVGDNDPTEEEAQETIDMIKLVLRVKIVESEDEALQEKIVRWLVDMVTRPNFNKFYYGVPTFVYSPKWQLHYHESFAYNMLPHQVPGGWFDDTKQLVAEYLALNLEICCRMIIDDIRQGKFERLVKDIEDGEIDIGDSHRFSDVYSTTVTEMREIDKKLIGVDEPTRFRLPEFGV